ncbi:MAG: hypothetical protein ABJN95_12570 [Maribacter sp.]|uniref:hypothetical protein n=1 Tax=Maribacter sp. TaxID=1897614 RepID=UPI0032973356
MYYNFHQVLKTSKKYIFPVKKRSSGNVLRNLSARCSYREHALETGTGDAHGRTPLTKKNTYAIYIQHHI